MKTQTPRIIGLTLCAALSACGRSQGSGSTNPKAAPVGVANAAPPAGAVSAPPPAQAPAIQASPTPDAKPDAGGKLNFETSCTLDGTTVKGYISNNSSEIYQVNGSVSFSFPNPNNTAIGEIRASANTAVPPNQTVLAATSSVPFVIEKQSACRFDVDDALHKQGR